MLHVQPFMSSLMPSLVLVHPLSFSAYRVYSAGCKRPEPEAYLSPPFSTDVKNEWSFTSVPSICLMSCTSVIAYIRRFRKFAKSNC